MTSKKLFVLHLKRVTGAYVILLDEDKPDTIIAARKGSPLVIGIGKENIFRVRRIAHAGIHKEVVYVNDYELAI